MSRLALLVLLVLLVLGTGCIDKTARSAVYVMEQRIDANRDRLRAVEKDLSLERARIEEMQERAAAARQRLADSGATLETFLDEMTRIRGELSRIGFQMEELGKFDEDLDLRLTSLEVQLGHIMTSLDVPPMTGVPLEGAAPLAVGGPVDVPGGGEPVDPAASEEDRRFVEAVELFKAGEFDRAGGRLQRFLQEHPDGARTLQARFLIAQCLYELGRYKPAIAEFQKVIEAESTAKGATQEHEWSPKAMFFQGLSFEQLGTAEDLDAASLFFEELINLYPDAPDSERARHKLEQLHAQ